MSSSHICPIAFAIGLHTAQPSLSHCLVTPKWMVGVPCRPKYMKVATHRRRGRRRSVMHASPYTHHHTWKDPRWRTHAHARKCDKEGRLNDMRHQWVSKPSSGWSQVYMMLKQQCTSIGHHITLKSRESSRIRTRKMQGACDLCSQIWYA